MGLAEYNGISAGFKYGAGNVLQEVTDPLGRAVTQAVPEANATLVSSGCQAESFKGLSDFDQRGRLKKYQTDATGYPASPSGVPTGCRSSRK